MQLRPFIRRWKWHKFCLLGGKNYREYFIFREFFLILKIFLGISNPTFERLNNAYFFLLLPFRRKWRTSLKMTATLFSRLCCAGVSPESFWPSWPYTWFGVTRVPRTSYTRSRPDKMAVKLLPRIIRYAIDQ